VVLPHVVSSRVRACGIRIHCCRHSVPRGSRGFWGTRDPVASLGDDAAALPVAPAPEADAADVAILPVGHWEQRFLQIAASDHSRNLPLSQSGDSRKFYDHAYSIDANVSMYEATGKASYLDRALLYTTNMVDDARPSSSLGSGAFGDAYLGWTSKATDSGNAGTYGTEVPLFESYAWRYVARMLRVLRESPLYASTGYRAQYDRLLRFTETNIFDKWVNRGANSYVYRANTHMASHWAYIALEVERLTTDSVRRQRARTVVDNIDLHLPNYRGASLKGQMRLGTVASGAYFWSSSWGSSSTPGQDVAHGNAVASYVTEARDLGVTWTPEDMTRFSKTLTDVILPSSAYVNGSGSGTGWLADGLVKLGRYSVAAQQRLETHQTQGQLQYMASMAVNAKRLTEGHGAEGSSGSPW